MSFNASQQNNRKLLNLRQVSPSRVFEMGLFSENKQKLSKIKAIPVSRENTIKHHKRADSQYVRNNVITERLNRKQTENLKQSNIKKWQNQHFNSTQKQTDTNENYHSKSMTSTKANSQKLSISNLSLQDSQDQKNYNNQNIAYENLSQNYNIKSSINFGDFQKLQLSNSQQKQELSSLKISDFEILNFCGEGSFGAVYIVRHIKTHSIFALKKILKQKLATEIDRQCLIRETKIHLKLDHPNIIKFYSAFSTQEAIYFLMELCCSGNLYQKLKKEGSLSQNYVRSFIRQVCNGINYLHEMNIIHRDIKAQNIVLHGNVAKICDFGWATQGQQSRKSLCGTPIYISPQIVKNQSYDNKVDIWSLGVLTFELIYGKIPFDIRCQDDLQKIVEEQISFPQDKEVSLACKDFITKCLQKDSFKRWDISRLLNHPFIKKE